MSIIEDKIFNTINKVYKNACKVYPTENVLGVFGYNLSDKIEIEAIIIPTFEDICLYNPLIDEKMNLDNIMIKCVDARIIYRATAQGHPEIIESLYTDYYLVNPRYKHLYEKLLRDNREIIKAGIVTRQPAKELKIALTTILRTAWNEGSNAVRFIKQLTDAEKLALEGIVQAIGDEGVFSQAKVASAIGVSRLTMSNLVAKMDRYKVAEIEHRGAKGTYVKIIDHTCLNPRGLELI